MRWPEAACGVAALLALAVGAAARAAPLTGVFAGGANPQAVAAFERWSGRPVDFVVDFDSATGYTTPDNIVGAAGWSLGRWRQRGDSHYNLLYSVPLSTRQDRSLAHVAQGRYDAQYERVAAALARSFPRAYVRLGWEFNGDWYPWAAKGRTADYVAAFGHVAAIFRAASPDFVIVWCPTEGYQQFPAQQAWPGDDSVDLIGLDVYDANWNRLRPDPERRWQQLVSEDHGLAWYARFAARHHKPIGYPEWGTGGAGTGDDPRFVQGMHEWMAAHPTALQAYWNSDASYHGRLDAGRRPQAAAMYRRLFGSGATPADPPRP